MVSLIEYNNHTKMWWRNYSQTLSKKQNWVYLWINSLKFYSLFFIIYQLEDYWSIMKLSCRLLTLNSYKAFLKNKNRSGKTLFASFFTKFLKKNLSYSITWPLTIFNCLVAFNLWDTGQYKVPRGKAARIFGYFSDPRFSSSLSMHYLVT